MFVEALRQELSNPQRVVRAFDVGGSGVKTAKYSAAALQSFLKPASCPESGERADTLPQLQWIEEPKQLGEAPGEAGFSSWLLHALPALKQEIEDPGVCFGVSVGGDIDHNSGQLQNWWPGGGHPREISYDNRPVVSDLMGLPAERTYVLHDGEAHLLGCTRCEIPLPCLGCLAIGTGVGFGLSNSAGAVVDPSSRQGSRSHLLNGIPLSGAPYKGIWKQWLQSGSNPVVDKVLAEPFANVVFDPWRRPWVSLVLGRRGMELAEAAHGCPVLKPELGSESIAEALQNIQRHAAVQAYGEQWLHFLHTQFLPQFALTSRRHPVQTICFAGGVFEHNWPLLRQVLLKPGSNELAAYGGGRAPVPEMSIRVLPPAPSGSGLIGAGIYALAGTGGGAQHIWTT
eukprot:TRINITY_DN64978_c0_g1_i1.p1 TRINITY_DN64978_c0_g1~~TRINITY_DN64978_c0_g1_i1.p1  ORF type:complete len:429 (-),score=66.02 TRINITY_DN64978_c0_g1_i1:30-1226(-)